MNEPVTIDPEFQSLIPPLTPDEFQQLKENCIRDGIQDSLKVWNGILIDGHNRFKISEDYDLNYRIEEMEFPDRETVRQWIIANQLGRRNVNTYTRSCLALELKESIQERAKEKQVQSGGAVPQKSAKPAIETREELARLANTSHDTINKVEYLESHADEKTKERLRNGEQSINSAWVDTKRQEQKKERTKQESALEAAMDRHEDFSQKKQEGIVSLEAIKQDKEDQTKIANALFWEIDKALSNLGLIGAMAEAGDKDLKPLRYISDEKTALLKNSIGSARKAIIRIQEVII